MASEAELSAAKFVLPSGTDLLIHGDDAIRANAAAAYDHTVSSVDRTAAAAAADAAAKAAAAQEAATAAGRAAAAAAELRTMLSAATALRKHLDTTHVALDADGTPYYSEGARHVQLHPDTDGAPYFIVTA